MGDGLEGEGIPPHPSRAKSRSIGIPLLPSAASEPFRTQRDPKGLNRTQRDHDFFTAVADGVDTSLASFAPFA